MTKVHATAAKGYGSGANVYARGRPEYAREAVDHLTAALDLRPGRRVLEIGAGTGKLTRALAGTGASTVAVEPVGAMRARLAEAVPSAEVLEGSAELLPLPNASVDAVVVAQAFHWFDAVRAEGRLEPGDTVSLHQA